jgi:hypothetical protein
LYAAGANDGRQLTPVLQAVAVALEADDLGVVDQPVVHGGGDHVVAEDLPQRPNGLLLVTIREARS